MKISELKKYKQNSEKITCLTVYDASFAKIFEACQVDAVLVGDSLGNVIQGGKNTLGVSMADMIYHTQAVATGLNKVLLIADMPYQSYTTAQQALDNAQKLMQAGAQMVKLEGGRAHQAVFEALQAHHIPVCGHLGLQPQSVLELGGYKLQGKDDSSADIILQDAKALASWGVEALVLECIPSSLGKIISQAIDIPTIGIGAGVDCDGQVLVSYDMLGISTGYTPKFVRNFLSDTGVEGAVLSFVQAVKTRKFPEKSQSY
jgi:3-methyl-2-oxobutanoate hydroxymethyltransferase